MLIMQREGAQQLGINLLRIEHVAPNTHDGAVGEQLDPRNNVKNAA